MRQVRFTFSVALMMALLGGCGATPTITTSDAVPSSPASPQSPAPSAADLVKKSGEALSKAGSFRMKGDVIPGGKELSIDVKVRGADALAVISMGAKGSITVLEVAGKSYYQGDDTFWRQSGGSDASALSSMFKGKWIKLKPEDAEMKALTDYADAKKYLDPLGAKSLTVGEKTTVNNVPAVPLKDASVANGVLYVAAEGEPYPLRVGTDAAGMIDFSEFGAKFDEIKAPPASKVISI